MADQVVGELAGVGPRAVDVRRAARPHGRQAEHVETGPVDDAAVVADPATPVEHGHLEPGVIGAGAGGPQDRADPGGAQVERERGRAESGRLRTLAAAPEELVDGGILDNLPVDLLTSRAEGPVAAVNISMGGSGGSRSRRVGKPRVPALGETLLRTMMIGSGGAVDAAHRNGAVVVTPANLGVGLLEFHQFDRMVRAGREAARALLDHEGFELGGQELRMSEPAAH